jgi:voltage-gated potassium channel Kch
MYEESKSIAGSGNAGDTGLRVVGAFAAIKTACVEFRTQNAGRTLRQKAHALLFPDARGGTLHLAVEIFLIFWIVASVFSIVCESVESLNTRYRTLFEIIDIASFVIFGLEYALRLYASAENNPSGSPWRARWHFVRSPHGMIDLVAILPFMLQLLLGGFADMRFLRIVRLLRLLKLSRYSSANDTMFAVLKKEAPVLAVSSLVMVLLVFIMAALGYLLEREAQPDKFENIPQSIYWAVVTLASVGYGDISPVTPAGRFATVVLALVGIGIFSIPAAVLASGFTEQLRLNRDRLKQDLIAGAAATELTEAARAALRGHWRSMHLSDIEIREMFEAVESGRRNEAPTGEGDWAPVLMASNPAYALAQYRSAVSRLQEVVALADPADLDRRLHVPGAATDLERRIWHVLRAPGEPGTTRCPR